ncbi:glycosyltransferase family 31 protein [Durotheca rogersii]|uniref:glycosyltransferase family 31 protein n=1 Tax=Durotheca rogersii TaxID=419775 RepID=UPI00222088C2|nr:glycosyltransferase family 31 protein [Durotheca rogersii]KAI5865061.1 glycosyltransferase family 31 protein [Durotheca rogersii]
MFRSILPYGRRSRTFQVLSSILVFCILLSTLRLYRRHAEPPRSIYEYTDGKTRGPRLNETGIQRPPSGETTYLRYLARQYELSDEVQYFARRIRPRANARGRESITQIATARFEPRGGFRRIRVDDEGLDLHVAEEEEAISIPVAKPAASEHPDASPLLFGISTSYDRLTRARASLVGDWARWLTDGKGGSNGASLVLTLRRASSAEIGHVSSMLRDAGIDAVVLAAEDGSRDPAARYLDLVRTLTGRRAELLRAEGREKSFLALVDDDVFFPSVGRLMARLRRYDAQSTAYLGLPSERSDWVVERNTTLTYGGGAVLLTPPAAEVVSRLPCLNGTSRGPDSDPGSRTSQWDEMLYNCVVEHTDEKLHVIPSLYTPRDGDVGDEATGTGYGDGARPLTLHHYGHRHRFEPGKAHLVTSLCGEACFLQRFLFRADSWVFVNGHSVAQYPDGVDVTQPAPSGRRDDEGNYRTDSGDGERRRNAGQGGGGGKEGRAKAPRRIRVGERLVVDSGGEGGEGPSVVSWAGTRRTWRLLDARAGPSSGGGGGGEVWQAYVRRRGHHPLPADEDGTGHTQDGPTDADSVIVLIWEPPSPPLS